MSTELENQIRAALQANVADLTADRLRYATSPRPAERRHRRRVWLVLAPVATAAAVAVAAVLITAHRAPAGSSAAGGTGYVPPFAGTLWRLTSVHQSGKAAVAIPARLDAHVEFIGATMFGEHDGVNYGGGTYRSRTPTSIDVSVNIETAAAYGGHDPVRLAALNGLAAIDKQGPVHVAVTWTPTHLTLAANGYTLLFANAGPVPTQGPPSPTPSAS